MRGSPDDAAFKARRIVGDCRRGGGARGVERGGGDCAANRCAARHSEWIGNGACTGARCVYMPCPLPDQQPLPAHLPGSEGTPDRGQGVACEWLEPVEVERSLS